MTNFEKFDINRLETSLIIMSCGCGHCCGGHEAANPEDVNIINAFKQGLQAYNTEHNTALEFVKIESVTKQVVSGFKFQGVVELKDGKYNFDIWQKAGGREVVVNSLTKQ